MTGPWSGSYAGESAAAARRLADTQAEGIGFARLAASQRS